MERYFPSVVTTVNGQNLVRIFINFFLFYGAHEWGDGQRRVICNLSVENRRSGWSKIPFQKRSRLGRLKRKTSNFHAYGLSERESSPLVSLRDLAISSPIWWFFTLIPMKYIKFFLVWFFSFLKLAKPLVLSGNNKNLRKPGASWYVFMRRISSEMVWCTVNFPRAHFSLFVYLYICSKRAPGKRDSAESRRRGPSRSRFVDMFFGRSFARAEYLHREIVKHREIPSSRRELN